MNRRVKLFISVWLFPLLVFASGKPAENSNSCMEIKSIGEFLDCTLKVHPEIQEIGFEESKAKGLIKQAKALPNPQLEADFSQTDNIGQTSETVELKLMQPILIGGKRSSRIRKANAESDLIAAEILKTKETVVIDSLVHLYRLRQVLEELRLVTESLSTFKEVKSQYTRRKSLGPEQTVSVDIFSIAEADYTMRQSGLESERGELLRKLSLFVGRPFSLKNDFVPKFVNEWPELPRQGEIKGSDIQKLKAMRAVAEGELDIARSDAWPDLAIGPTYSAETENNDRITTVGVSIELPLPIFNLNGGAKAVALSEKQRAEVHERNERNNLMNIRINLSEIYNSITQRLKSIDPESIEATKHKRIHKYLKRGVVEAALVIESHRQIVEFQEHTNEQELKALSALWQVRALDGELFNEIEKLKNLTKGEK